MVLTSSLKFLILRTVLVVYWLKRNSSLVYLQIHVRILQETRRNTWVLCCCGLQLHTLHKLTFDLILMVVRVQLALMKTPTTYQLWNELISQIGLAFFLLPRIRLNVTLNLHFSPYNCVDFLNWNLNNRTNCKKIKENSLGLLEALVFGFDRSSRSHNVCKHF